MKKLIYKPLADAGKKVFFHNVEQFIRWVNSQEKGVLVAVDDHNIVNTVFRHFTGYDVWGVCHVGGFITIPFEDLIEKYDLYWVDNDQMLSLTDTGKN